jgi:hypothetical protein
MLGASEEAVIVSLIVVWVGVIAVVIALFQTK